MDGGDPSARDIGFARSGAIECYFDRSASQCNWRGALGDVEFPRLRDCSSDFVLCWEPVGDSGHRGGLGGSLSLAASTVVCADFSEIALSPVRIPGDDVAGGKRLCSDGSVG